MNQPTRAWKNYDQGGETASAGYQGACCLLLRGSKVRGLTLTK